MLFVTAISFANNVESKSLLEKTTEANQLELNVSDDEVVVCPFVTRRVFYRMAKKEVLSMHPGETLIVVWQTKTDRKKKDYNQNIITLQYERD